MSKHPPTSAENREATLRYQAERLLRDAAAWGYAVEILAPGRRTGNEQAINVRPAPCESSGECRTPGAPGCTADSCGLAPPPQFLDELYPSREAAGYRPR